MVFRTRGKLLETPKAAATLMVTKVETMAQMEIRGNAKSPVNNGQSAA